MFSTIGAVIPAYNEEHHLSSVLENVKKYIAAENIIVVDDGSSDRTAEIATEAGVTLLEQEINSGKGKALRRGFDHLSCLEGIEAVITLDADGQHDPAEIPLFVKKFNESGDDIIVGNRMSETAEMPFVRKMTNRLTSKVISRLAGCTIRDSQSGYRLIRTDLLRNIELSSDRFDGESEILIKSARNGASIGSITIKSIYAAEKSKINPFIDTVRFFRLVFKSYFW
ncbi:MAG: glycosyltransferase family 2 protein [Candidatus Krumholzibacteriota bacterium]|nr:glycosyltransferase family 2 protein [Candidatus Krumholzibacteriota bacterium]